MSPFQTFAARLYRSVSLSTQTRHLEFEISDKTHFGFVAGQWLSFKTSKPDGEEITRAYSIASPPGDDNRFALCLNRVQDGFMSNFLCDMKEGEEISCQGPFGDFILRPPLRDTVFIATGTGIAPFRSMLHWLLADPVRHQDKQLWLLFGNRTESRHLLPRRISETGRQAFELSAICQLLSRGAEDWPGLRGYVQEHVAESFKAAMTCMPTSAAWTR